MMKIAFTFKIMHRYSVTRTSITYNIRFVFGVSSKAQVLILFGLIMDKCFDQQYYRLNKIYFSFSGIWPEQSLFWRCLLPFTFLATLISSFIPQLIRMIDVRGDIDRLIECIPTLLVMATAIAKLLNYTINAKKVRKLMNHISYGWEYFKDPPSTQVLQNYAANGRFITLVYSIYLYVSMVAFLILPVLPAIFDIIMPLNESRPRQFLYEAEYGLENPDDYFFEILIHAYITSIATVSIYVTADSMYFVLVNHGCALFKVVATNLKLSFHDGHPANEEEDLKIIRYCMNLHKDALSFADLLESTFATSFAGIFFAYLLTMSMTGVLTVIKIGHIDEMIRFAILALAFAISLYLSSVPGQNLIDHSLYIGNAVYDIEWCDLSTKVQKLLVLMILRSSRPSVLTAGKVYLISMENYSAVRMQGGQNGTIKIKSSL